MEKNVFSASTIAVGFTQSLPFPKHEGFEKKNNREESN
jgi:hypothetical protein